ncbi:hupL element site-specific recombinase XisC [Calothrix parasitica NIES-267]|uniref:HupL element site-specific recombinase XisC n=1 Tax=Calothrix parasitica NIES-267 TaxID=1973488 RepID=A0A1Z4LX97_9CYAN|nr:hupL element site-specific recombinase XisC [Calothrix parasitica NIES-267]
MDDIQGNVFNDFKVPNTSDGSYRGKMEIVNEQKKHFNIKLREKLAEVNQRLKQSKTKVAIEMSSGSMQLRATLPLKPEDVSKNGKQTKQYKISLGIPANFDGLKTAEEEAQELGKLIARKTFVWNDKYLGIQASSKNNITYNQFYQTLEKRYFSTRKRTIKSEHTFMIVERFFKRYFLTDSVISPETMIGIVKDIPLATIRNKVISLCSFICEEVGIHVNLNDFKLEYKLKERTIPSDKEIIESIDLFRIRYSNHMVKTKANQQNWIVYKQIYGLMATYGLRPREVINKPDLDWFVSKENIHHTFKVHGDNKTGSREVFPFVPDWVELFNLKSEIQLNYLKEFAESWHNVNQLESRIVKIAANFRRAGIKFKPYDLRHACAIRAHLQRVPIKAAADNLGHTVEIHTKTYQKWFSLDNRRKAFDTAFEEEKENEELKTEIITLKKKIFELEAELAFFKA